MQNVISINEYKNMVVEISAAIFSVTGNGRLDMIAARSKGKLPES
jgi:hypothetical protein